MRFRRGGWEALGKDAMDGGGVVERRAMHCALCGVFISGFSGCSLSFLDFGDGGEFGGIIFSQTVLDFICLFRRLFTA